MDFERNMSKKKSQQQINENEWKNPANWTWMIFYFSEKDTRDWVPKHGMFGRKRSGGTPNLARKGARIYLLAILGIGLVLLVVVMYLEKSGMLP